MGHAGRQKDSVNDLRFQFDRAERLIEIREAANSDALWEEFIYATTNLGANLRRGKLWQAIRHNPVNIPWSSSTITDIVVTEIYTYAGRGGRASRRDTALSPTDQSFKQT